MHIEIKNCFSFWGTSFPQTPYRGFAPGPHWETSVPRSPAQYVPPPHILYQVYARGDDDDDDDDDDDNNDAMLN